MDGRETTSINLGYLLLLSSSNKRRIRIRGEKRRRRKDGGDLPRSGIKRMMIEELDEYFKTNSISDPFMVLEDIERKGVLK